MSSDINLKQGDALTNQDKSKPVCGLEFDAICNPSVNLCQGCEH